MPELPEVETTLRGIQSSLINTKIKKLIIRNGSLRWPVEANLPDKLLNQPVLSVSRRAKYLLIEFPVGTLMIHLGMSGYLRVISQETPVVKHDHIDLVLDNGLALRYHDPRRFGAWLFTDQPVEQHKLIQHLAPEPLSDEFNSDWLYPKIHGKRSAIKTLIMNNEIAVGVGNIYANESLFLTGIHPKKPGNKVTKKQSEELIKNIKLVLTKAIKQGGTTLKDFQSPDGKPGYFVQALNVYGRDGQPCPSCDSLIEKIVLNQRAAFFCPKCQIL